MNTASIEKRSREIAHHVNKYAAHLSEASVLLYAVGSILKSGEVRELHLNSTILPVEASTVEGQHEG